MRPLATLNLAGIAALWVAAVALLPSLPERLPVHFDLAGRPDAWSDSRAWWWLLPALATALDAGLAFGLPALADRLARANSPMLSVPDAARFRALPVDARLRALAPMRSGMALLGLEMQVLVALLMAAMVRGDRDQPLHPVWFASWIGALLATIVVMTVRGVRAVRAETVTASP